MGNPIFRFTLQHAETGSLEITEPDGWIDAKLKFERHEEFHSLIEYFEGAFVFYGTNGVDNGGIDFIRYVEQNYGADATINIYIEVSFDSAVTYEDIFTGQLDLTTLNELKDNRAQIAIIRDDFWAKFISRKDTPVNLQATTDFDGASISPVDTIHINLPSQKLRYNGSYQWGETYTYYQEDDFNGNSLEGMQLDWEIVLKDDLKKFTIPRARITLDKNDVAIAGSVIAYDSLTGNFEAPFDGDYTLDIKIYTSQYEPLGNDWVVNSFPGDGVFFYVFKTTETAQTEANVFSRTQIDCGTDEILEHTFNKTIRLLRGEQIAIWGRGGGELDAGVTVFGSTQLTWNSATVASTAPLILSGEQTIDGVLTSSDIVLAKDQADPAENGLWLTGAGAWTRSPGADTASELNVAAVYITAGDTNINTHWKQDNIINTVDVDPQTWIFTLPSDEKFKAFPFCFTPDAHLIIYADTTFRQTRSEGLLIHDAGAAILKSYGLGVDNPFYSEYLGGLLTNSRVYPQDGCAWHYAILKGLQVRGYPLEDKPFFQSFTQWWKGANPIFNLGLTYESTQIVIEEKEEFYDATPSVYFDYVFEISREYDDEKIFNKIEIGYNNWRSEDVSGIDDVQTKHTYAAIFKKIGKGIELMSDWIAASLAFEATRRQTISLSKDYKFDDNTFILSLNPDDVSPDAYLPEVDENFSSITNLLNSETRYNTRLSVGRNFLRWRNFLNGALQSYLTSAYKFVGGEGNYDMTSNLISSCDVSGELSEKQDIPVTADFLHLPLIYNIEINLAWDDYVLMRNNRKRAIGISQTDANHTPFFIKSLEYELVKGKATIKAWPKTYFQISQTDFVPQMRQCVAVGTCGTGELDRITSDGQGRVTSDGECRVIA